MRESSAYKNNEAPDDTGDMHDLSGFQRDLLYVAAGLDEPSGQAIKGETEDYYGEPINNPRLYLNLNELVDSGLMNKQRLNQAKLYTLSPRGEQEIRVRRKWENQYIDDL